MVYDVNGNVISSNSYGNEVFCIEPYESDDQQALVSTFSGVIALYDALVTTYPDYVTKSALTNSGFTNYEYKFTSGNYNSYSTHRYSQDATTVKPKILITAGIHGYEQTAVMANYLFFKSLCEGKNGLQYLREAFEFRTIPIVNPWGYNNNNRYNSNNVDLNRNFDASWTSRERAGSSAASESETKLTQAWIDANSDAKLFFDHHNSEIVNEICTFQSMGTQSDVVNIKKQALKTANHIICHWKIDRNIPSTNTYLYTGTSQTDHGMVSMYARDKGISSLLMETSWNVNSTGLHSNFTIGVSAEAEAIVLIGACTCIA